MRVGARASAAAAAAGASAKRTREKEEKDERRRRFHLYRASSSKDSGRIFEVFSKVWRVRERERGREARESEKMFRV